MYSTFRVCFWILWSIPHVFYILELSFLKFWRIPCILKIWRFYFNTPFTWLDLPLVDYVNGVPKWCYTTYKWLYPPWQPKQEGTWYISEILQGIRWSTQIGGRGIYEDYNIFCYSCSISVLAEILQVTGWSTQIGGPGIYEDYNIFCYSCSISVLEKFNDK